MYTGKNEFNADVNPEILESQLTLRNVASGSFTYEGEFNGIRIMVESSMNDVENMNYFQYETVAELLESDIVKVYFNEVCALWVA